MHDAKGHREFDQLILSASLHSHHDGSLSKGQLLLIQTTAFDLYDGVCKYGDICGVSKCKRAHDASVASASADYFLAFEYWR